MALAFCLALFAGLGVAGSPGIAAASPLYVVPGNSLQIPAGGTGYLQVRGIALQPSANIPTTPLTLASQQLQAGDRLRTTIFYGIDWGYSDSAPQQVALAVWWAQDGNWRNADHATAERIATAAANTGIPSWNPDGRNVITAIAQGQVSISELTLAPLSQTTAVGNGTIAIRNTSGSDLTVNMPYGSLFGGASGSALVWATGTGGAPPQASPTSQSVTEPTATTQTPPTSTPQAAAPSPTPVTRKGGGQPPPQQPTDTPLPQGEAKGATATPSSVPATNTPVGATDTPQPTSTPQPTDTPLPASTPAVPQQSGTGSQGAPQSPPQLPPSQPQQPVQQKGNSPGTTSSSGTSNFESKAPVTQPDTQAKQVPSQSAEGPPLPLTPDPTRSSTATATRTGTGGAGDAPPPPPVGTSVSNGPPPPVNTSAARATVPFPVSTSNPTSAPSDNGKPPAPVETAALAKPTAPAEGVPPGSTDGNSGKPTPAPTPAPPPADTEPPVIIVDPNGAGGSASGTSGSGSLSGGDAGASNSQQGSAPKENPITGAGPSSMPLWLSVAAFLMLLGGWTLRRVGHHAPAVRESKE